MPTYDLRRSLLLPDPFSLTDRLFLFIGSGFLLIYLVLVFIEPRLLQLVWFLFAPAYFRAMALKNAPAAREAKSPTRYQTQSL